MHDDRNDIDRYLRDEMTPRERHLFEKRMLSDPFLSEAVEGAQSVRSEEFREDVKSLSQQLRDQRDNAWGMSIRIAAGVVLVFAVGWLAYRGDSQGEKKELATAKTDSITSGLQDTTKQMLSLAQPEPSETVASGAASKLPQSIARTAAPTDSTPSTAGSGAVAPPSSVTPYPTPAIAQTQADLAAEDESATKEAAVASRARRDAAPQSLSQGAGDKKAIDDVSDSTIAQVTILEPAATRMKTIGPGSVPASPIGGMDSYRKYLVDNRKVPPRAQGAGIHGTVVIIFTIAPNGTLTNFIRSSDLGYGCEEEVERLLQQGPKWNPAKSGSTPLVSQAQVSLAF